MYVRTYLGVPYGLGWGSPSFNCEMSARAQSDYYAEHAAGACQVPESLLTHPVEKVNCVKATSEFLVWCRLPIRRRVPATRSGSGGTQCERYVCTPSHPGGCCLG